MSCIEFHGHLSSNNVVVDSRWTCKISDYGLRYVRSLIHTEHDHVVVPGTRRAPLLHFHNESMIQPVATKFGSLVN